MQHLRGEHPFRLRHDYSGSTRARQGISSIPPARAGELSRSQLAPVVNINHFWFSWAAFKPDTRIYRP